MNTLLAGNAVPAVAREEGAPFPHPRYWEPSWLIFGLFLTFVVARYMGWGARRAIFAAIRIEFTLGLLLTVICVALLMTQRPTFRQAKTVIIAISCLFAVMVIQVPFAANTVAAKDVFLDRVIKFAFLTLFMMVLISSPRYLTFFMYAFLFSCFYITQESVRGLISGGLVWQNQGVMRLHGAVPMYAHPNSLSGLAMGTIPFVVFLFPVWRRWFLRGALLALLATSIICVIYTGSRTGYIGFLAFVIYWFALVRRKGRWLFMAVIITAVGLSVLPQQYKDRFLSIGGHAAEGESREARLQIQKDAIAIFLENPAGVGVSSFTVVRMAKFGRFQDTHNLYLEVATNLGIQGLVVFLILVGMILSSYRRAYRSLRQQAEGMIRALKSQDRDRRQRARLVGHLRDLDFLAAVCQASGGFIVVRLVLGLFGMDLYEIYWWFGAGLAICLLGLAQSTAKYTRQMTQSA